MALTYKDIATLAATNVASVSYVLNNKDKGQVRAEVRDRILDVGLRGVVALHELEDLVRDGRDRQQVSCLVDDRNGWGVLFWHADAQGLVCAFVGLSFPRW